MPLNFRGCLDSDPIMDRPAVLVAICAARKLQLPPLPSHVWQKVHAFTGTEYFPEDLEGCFPLQARGEPTPGVPGNGHREFQVLFVGSTHGRNSDALWYHPPTTSNRLPAVVADLVRPGV